MKVIKRKRYVCIIKFHYNGRLVAYEEEIILNNWSPFTY